MFYELREANAISQLLCVVSFQLKLYLPTASSQ
jgi:hypothetical protein